MSDFKAKMQKIRFPLRLRSDTGGEAYSAPPDPLAVFKGPTSKGRAKEEGGEGKGRRREEKGREGVREGRKGEGPGHPNILP